MFSIWTVRTNSILVRIGPSISLPLWLTGSVGDPASHTKPQRQNPVRSSPWNKLNPSVETTSAASPWNNPIDNKTRTGRTERIGVSVARSACNCKYHCKVAVDELCFSYITCSSLRQNKNAIMKSSLYLYRHCIAAYKQLSITHVGTHRNNMSLSFLAPRFVSLSYFSSSSSSTGKRARTAKQAKKVYPQPLSKQESEAFYVVRKGDTIGVYKSFSECQAQVSASICDPSVGVYKGYSLLKETEEYLTARGLKNAVYTMSASDLRDDLFGDLVPCPFQQPDGLAFLVEEHTAKIPPLKGNQDMTSCIIEFDGASRGNPGKSGAGAVIRSKDGEVIAKLREGLGDVTNNVAEYRALLLGLKFAVDKGFKNIQVQGDSNLVVKMVSGQWKGRKAHLLDLCQKAKELKEKFASFEISHVRREFNADADVQANLGADLPAGEIQEESSIFC